MSSCPSCDGRRRIPKGVWEKAEDALRALSAGKMPTQQQLDLALDALLSSNLLKVDDTATGTLSAHGKLLALNVTAVLKAVARIGMEKNADNLIQDIIWQCRLMRAVLDQLDANRHNQSRTNIDSDVDATVHHLSGVSGVEQTEVEDDSQAFPRALRTLISLLSTSSEFRHLLSDILVTTRQIVADIEGRLTEESLGRIKQTIVERVKAIVQQAQGNSVFQTSLKTLVTLCGKYADLTAQATDSAVAAARSAANNSTVQPSVSVDPVIETDPHLKRLLEDIRTLLERFAGGYSLSPLGDSMKQFLEHISQYETSGIPDLLRDAKLWLRKALETPGWLTTRAAREDLDELYDRTKAILDSKPSWRTDLQNALAEASAFSDHLRRDTATQQLLSAMIALDAYMRDLGVESVRNVAWRQIRADLWRDAVGWFLPRILAIVEVVPLHRVELKNLNDSLDLVVDDVTFRAPSFIPDHVRVENRSETRVEDSSRGKDWVAEAASALRVQINGFRITAHEIAYSLHLKSASYRDQGKFCIDIGHKSAVGQGLNLDVSLETDLEHYARTAVAPDSNAPPASFFLVRSATINIPKLNFTLGHSYHWILNACMLPFRNYLVRHGLSRALSQSIKGGLEAFDRKLGELYAHAKGAASSERLKDATRSQPGIWDWWNALLKGQSVHSHDAKGGPAHAADKTEEERNVERGRKGWESRVFDF